MEIEFGESHNMDVMSDAFDEFDWSYGEFTGTLLNHMSDSAYRATENISDSATMVIKADGKGYVTLSPFESAVVGEKLVKTTYSSENVYLNFEILPHLEDYIKYGCDDEELPEQKEMLLKLAKSIEDIANSIKI